VSCTERARVSPSQVEAGFLPTPHFASKPSGDGKSVSMYSAVYSQKSRGDKGHSKLLYSVMVEAGKQAKKGDEVVTRECDLRQKPMLMKRFRCCARQRIT